MSPLEASWVLSGVLVLLLVFGLWIGAAVGLSATFGFIAFSNTPASLNLARAFWEVGSADALAWLPLFIVPGILLMSLFSACLVFRAWRHPEKISLEATPGWHDRLWPTC